MSVIRKLFKAYSFYWKINTNHFSMDFNFLVKLIFNVVVESERFLYTYIYFFSFVAIYYMCFLLNFKQKSIKYYDIYFLIIKN